MVGRGSAGVGRRLPVRSTAQGDAGSANQRIQTNDTTINNKNGAAGGNRRTVAQAQSKRRSLRRETVSGGFAFCE